MNNKIGIITMYHKSKNYGGVLQAYALQKFLNNNGFEAFQICYQKEQTNKTIGIKTHLKESGIAKTLIWFNDRLRKRISTKIANKILGNNYKKQFNKRIENFNEFRDEIQHTSNIYTQENVKELNDIMDIFICGSDQIWKPGVICPDYMLNFVDDKKIKISYAASISKTNISDKDLEYMIPYLTRFNKISVREESDVKKLSQKIKRNVSWVIDPTLLLNEEEWSSVCSNTKITNEKYLFCYLLEANSRKYKIIKKFAKNNNLKIVTIPFSNGDLNLKDIKFGDIRATDAGPKDFLSLIKNAEMVITDSFHAAVFSNIFKTKFFVLERTEAPTMNSRIVSLLNMFNMMDRFINDNELLSKNLECSFRENNEFNSIKKFSTEYLLSLKTLKGDSIE